MEPPRVRNSTAALKGKFTQPPFFEILNKAPCLEERSEKSSRPSPVQLSSPPSTLLHYPEHTGFSRSLQCRM